jgi:hypothetical protein
VSRPSTAWTCRDFVMRKRTVNAETGFSSTSVHEDGTGAIFPDSVHDRKKSWVLVVEARGGQEASDRLDFSIGRTGVGGARLVRTHPNFFGGCVEQLSTSVRSHADYNNLQKRIATNPPPKLPRPSTIDIMAAFVKAINAKIRSNPTVSYFCSTRTSASFLNSCPFELRRCRRLRHGEAGSRRSSSCRIV